MLPLSVVDALAEESLKAPRRRIGRYAIFGEIASGGMATVYFGRLVGAVGFSRSVAIKQLHPQYARSPEFVAQFLDEARLTARIRHPNVVSVLDVVARDGELFVIMEFVQGEPLSRLARFAREPVPLAVASAILVQVLLGLQAAHDATTDRGEPLEIVHRDVSPQNMLVGVDGASHILDFGVAKAASRVHTTENGQIKGKLAYMAPEQLRNLPLDRRVDVFAAGVVLWELITGKRLFAKGDPGATVTAILTGEVELASRSRPEVSPALDALLMKALAPSPDDRFATARDMAVALETCVPPASSLKVGAWVEHVAGASLQERALRLREAEESTGVNTVISQESLQRSLASAPISFAPPPDAHAPPQSLIETATHHSSAWVRRERARAWLLPVSVGVGAALLTAAAFGLRTGHDAKPGPAVAPSSSAAAPVPGPSATMPARAVQVDDLPTSPAVPAPSAAVAQPRPTTTPKRTVKHAVLANCVPPYVLDAQGRKKFKPECF